jgi:hypothetical protein
MDLATSLVSIVAGFEAHEALEFARFDGSYVVNPHGREADLRAVSDVVTNFILSTAVRTDEAGRQV